VAPDTSTRELSAAAVGAAVATPSPVSYIPANSTGIMWVQGHLSIFANVNGALTIRGFRGNLAYYAGEMLPGPPGQWFSRQLNIGVPGGFVNDLAFTKLPGKQTVIYVAVDTDTASAFRDELNATRYNEPYKYSPPRPDAKPRGKEARMRQFLIAKGGEAMAVECGNNCITVPVRQIESAIGMRPQVDTKGGRLDITTGRIGEGPVNPHEKGRASHPRDFVDAPDLSKAKPGATRIGMTGGAVATMGAVRIGGGIWMVYGGVQSARRLLDALGTDDLPQVAAEEAAAWTGGIAAAQLGGAIATGIGESVLLVTGGEVTAIFVASGFGVSLGLGYLGARAGVALVRAVFDAPNALIWGTTTFLEGFMDANVAAGNFLHSILIDVKLRPVVVARERINPANWDLRGLPPEAANAVRNLGMAAWSTLGPLNADELRASAGKSFAQMAAAPLAQEGGVRPSQPAFACRVRRSDGGDAGGGQGDGQTEDAGRSAGRRRGGARRRRGRVRPAAPGDDPGGLRQPPAGVGRDALPFRPGRHLQRGAALAAGRLPALVGQPSPKAGARDDAGVRLRRAPCGWPDRVLRPVPAPARARRCTAGRCPLLPRGRRGSGSGRPGRARR
jgi:hypothetical protein